MTKNKKRTSSETIAMVDFELNKKKIIEAYILWFLFGLFGAHRFYLNQGWSAKVMLVNGIRVCIYFLTLIILTLSWTSFVPELDIVNLIGAPLAAVFIFWWLIDAFFIPNMVKKYNQKLNQDEKATSSDDAIMDFNANKKSIGLAYLLLLFFGGSGVHRFYLKQDKANTMLSISCLLQILMFLDTIVYLSLLEFGPPDFSDIACMGLLIILVWRIADAFFIPNMVREHNQELANRIKGGDRDE